MTPTNGKGARVPGAQTDVVLNCTDCGTLVVLPPVPTPEGRTGSYVSIENLTGWTAPPLRCPGCSARQEADLNGTLDRGDVDPNGSTDVRSRNLESNRTNPSFGRDGNGRSTDA